MRGSGLLSHMLEACLAFVCEVTLKQIASMASFSKRLSFRAPHLLVFDGSAVCDV